MLEVRRAPFVPIGSLTTWTRTGWSRFEQFRDISFALLSSSFAFALLELEIEIHIKHLLKFLSVLNDVGDVDKAVFSLIDIDKSRLDVVENVSDVAAVDVARQLTGIFTLDDQIVQLAVAQVSEAALFSLNI